MLQASQIEVRTRYQPSEADNAFPVSPLRAIQNWARDRLRASGQGGPARFTIADATAKINDLPVQGGISGAFTDQVSQQYDAAVDAALELLDIAGRDMMSDFDLQAQARIGGGFAPYLLPG